MESNDKKLTLPDFLKLMTNNNVPIPKAMAVASKLFKEFNTPALLAQLDDAKLQAVGVENKDLRKLVLAAIRKAGYIKPRAKPKSEGDLTPLKKKRKRDDESNEFLPEAPPPDDASAYGNMDFGEVVDEEVLKTKSTVANRAPLMTAWATVVAERLGFEREEALSIGSVYTEMNAVTKGVFLGLVDESRKKEIEPIPGERQPYVNLMGRRRPLYQTQSSKWRALVGGSPALPSTAFSYISRAFRQTTPHVMGALRLLAASYPPPELNNIGFSLYADFRPVVDGWGKRGEVPCERILSLRKKGGREGSEAQSKGDVIKASRSNVLDELPSKKAKILSLEEYEAALDEDLSFNEADLGQLP
ncbi:hypothetical protein PAXRUDRAFT_146685 [Paxillus rubicundulus Ve08.2h10]|uniref:Uncharacterized protein n=1 Tax=Paxillus rubicundulus Ve08.2h10 TaxID=930991 RepID=A0A0D0DMB4_9AGAM|nr:hypothetical protein PAXRUDRAFT_146685 [Paxillus rubicundulus Ve08.2h10]